MANNHLSPSPSHGATATFPRPVSSQSPACPGGSRAEISRRPCHGDQPPAPSTRAHAVAPGYLETPGGWVLGHSLGLGSSLAQDSSAFCPGKPGVSRVVRGPNPAPSSAMPTLLGCPQS